MIAPLDDAAFADNKDYIGRPDGTNSGCARVKMEPAKVKEAQAASWDSTMR